MITFREFLQEEKIEGTKPENNVYVNPSKQDIIGMVNDLTIGKNDIVLKFLADKKSKDVYFWYGANMTHDEMMSVIKKKYNIFNIDEVYTDNCKIVNGKITFDKFNMNNSMLRSAYSLIKKKDFKTKGNNIPLPYKTLKDFTDNIKTIYNSYLFVDKYIGEYSTKSSLAILKDAVK